MLMLSISKHSAKSVHPYADLNQSNQSIKCYSNAGEVDFPPAEKQAIILRAVNELKIQDHANAQ